MKGDAFPVRRSSDSRHTEVFGCAGKGAHEAIAQQLRHEIEVRQVQLNERAHDVDPLLLGYRQGSAEEFEEEDEHLVRGTYGHFSKEFPFHVLGFHRPSDSRNVRWIVIFEYVVVNTVEQLDKLRSVEMYGGTRAAARTCRRVATAGPLPSELLLMYVFVPGIEEGGNEFVCVTPAREP